MEWGPESGQHQATCQELRNHILELIQAVSVSEVCVCLSQCEL